MHVVVGGIIVCVCVCARVWGIIDVWGGGGGEL